MNRIAQEARKRQGVKLARKHDRRYPELLKIRIDVKEVPYNCLRGKIQENCSHLYRRTVIDECTRVRFIYGFEEHTPENSVRFLKLLIPPRTPQHNGKVERSHRNDQQSFYDWEKFSDVKQPAATARFQQAPPPEPAKKPLSHRYFLFPRIGSYLFTPQSGLSSNCGFSLCFFISSDKIKTNLLTN